MIPVTLASALTGSSAYANVFSGLISADAPARRRSISSRLDRSCSSHVPLLQRLTSFSRSYMLAISANRFRRPESVPRWRRAAAIVWNPESSAVASSSHIAASPPRISFFLLRPPDSRLPPAAGLSHNAATRAASDRDNTPPRESQDNPDGPRQPETSRLARIESGILFGRSGCRISSPSRHTVLAVVCENFFHPGVEQRL